jgi:class 3 adenylate cyclase
MGYVNRPLAAANRPLCMAFGKLGPRYPRTVLALQFQMAHVVTLGGLGLLKLYQPMSSTDFWRILFVTQVLVAIENVLALRLAFRLVGPADPWLAGRRNGETALAAWHALADLPVRFTQHRRWLAVFCNLVPISVYVTAELGKPWWTGFVILAGAAVVLLYGLILRFFATELTMRPVLEEVSKDLPDGADLGDASVPLRWKLAAALPAINVVTGVTVAGLSNAGQATLTDLGLDVLVAVLVAFTISFELTQLLSRSILAPLQDLREATGRVKAGDLSVRVPVVSSDEMGALAGSFNEMVVGLAEREKLREAFGAFVDPEVAERVLEQGTVLEGDEVEVSVLFLDIRGFTAFAERSSAREVVTALNDFYEVVVPILIRHRGHANKFIGDGLLGVFGAPDPVSDHADRAVAAALEIAATVKERYGESLAIGIGVNSGPVVAGTVGGGGRVEFTVIGDAVNTAARVEKATRETGDTVLVTEATCALLTRDFGGFEERPTIALRGKAEHVGLHAPTATFAPAPERPVPAGSGR